MSRSSYAIAYSAVGDLLAVQTSFDNTKAILELIMKRVPEDSDVYAIAELGMLDIAQWEGKVLDWASMMDDELDETSLNAEAEAHALKRYRMAMLKHSDMTKVS